MNYIHTARSKGLKERTVILRYGLKNAAPVILTAIGQSFGSLITGTIVTETLFNIPGLGMLTLSSINRRDVFVIQGVVLFVTLLYVIVNLTVDVLYGFVDPRLRTRIEIGGDEKCILHVKVCRRQVRRFLRNKESLQKKGFWEILH